MTNGQIGKCCFTIHISIGTIPSERSFLEFADLVVIHETELDQSGSFQIPDWICEFDASSVALIYHTAGSTEEMLAAVARGKEINAGFMYITDDVLDNPFDTLPTFYREEVEALVATLGEVTCMSG